MKKSYSDMLAYYNKNYEAWRGRSVEDLAAPPEVELTPEQRKRHKIYALALMAITYHYWNGNKYGRWLKYPMNDLELPAHAEKRDDKLADDYIGHNIAALAVDGSGRIIDFELNHNEIFNSSVEHAESRLLRRLFGLTQIQDSWNTNQTSFDPTRYGTLLGNVSLYTTLESCAQCAGIMTLAALKEVIYLQTDPGQYGIGNMMRKLTEQSPDPKKKPQVQMPLPIPASLLDQDPVRFPYFNELDEGYRRFYDRPRDIDHAMVLQWNKEKREYELANDSATTSITSFLCTEEVRAIYGRAAAELTSLEKEQADALAKLSEKDKATAKREAKENAMTESGALTEALAFVRYATLEGLRATPHRT